MFDFFTDSKKVSSNYKCTAIIVAAGKGTRMKETENKIFADILGKPLLAYTLEAFEECHLIQDIIIVTREEDVVDCRNEIVDAYGFIKVSKIVTGGLERQTSVYRGLQEVGHNIDMVVIHDGARPLVRVEDIKNSIYECAEHGASVVGVKVKDTVKFADQNDFIDNTPQRDHLWIAQTPQTFNYKMILRAHQSAIEDGVTGTDDSSLVERLGAKVKLVEGSYQNIKVTTEEDIYVIESILENDTPD